MYWKAEFQDKIMTDQRGKMALVKSLITALNRQTAGNQGEQLWGRAEFKVEM